MAQEFDIAVIGAGIAGASVAAYLAQAGKRIALLEMESQPGYHTTGRSAAVYAPSYGPAPIRALTRASKAFFTNPPDGFSDTPLFTPRTMMMIARADQLTALHQLEGEVKTDTVRIVDEAGLRALNPLVRSNYAQAALVDTAGQDIEVSALHQGFLRQFKEAGGILITNAEAQKITQSDPWQIETRHSDIRAEILVNAAGAWAGMIGQGAGAEHIGLTPKRRTALIIAAPDKMAIGDYPITIDVQEQFYLKPDAGRLLVSPADATPSDPCDAQPDELDVAICVDRIETAFDLQVRRIENKWAGLRSFVPDGAPVAGFSGSVNGFYWLAGQGGYGIQSAPALAEVAAAQILGRQIPAYITDQGFDPETVGPSRLGQV
ncbi:FAD-binding oxidoreductase [Sulfitobacter sp. F26204]|uniref:NAD(P)/FAD-dependent oxidoreductase n=1 Tax=Sulfitobacter sp. F26204 TaxID=2996014 RepID=UPI00225E6899|nr:FAD-binding oxidoreductase [Sulfitobacter sp. F26204]MCX7558418.1 FAD-binding oxidoreductase [Sulfitobacter sp. F26204]